MSMAPRNSVVSDWFVVLLVVGLIAFGLALVYKENEEAKKLNAQREDFRKNCKEVGDAIDGMDRSGTELRIIFQCPDGRMYIR